MAPSAPRLPKHKHILRHCDSSAGALGNPLGPSVAEATQLPESSDFMAPSPELPPADTTASTTQGPVLLDPSEEKVLPPSPVERPVSIPGSPLGGAPGQEGKNQEGEELGVGRPPRCQWQSDTGSW